ncbi:hypothetical protein BGZ94_003447, partial [Podila epigama]
PPNETHSQTEASPRSGTLGPSVFPPSTLPAQVISKPRRHKVNVNSVASVNDAAFPVQIQEELLNQVRYWTSQAEMKEKLNQEYDTKISEQERIIDALNKQRRLREESEERQKEEQWNLELQNQELRNQNGELQAQLSKTTHENTKLQKAFATATEQVEQLKDKEEKTAAQLELVKTRHEQDMAAMRKHNAGVQREKSDLLKKVEDMNATVIAQQQKLSKKATLEALALAQELEEREQENEAGVQAPILIQAPARIVSNDETTLGTSLSASSTEPKIASLARETSFAHQQSIISELQSKLSKEITEKEEILTTKAELLAEKEELVKLLADREEQIETLRLEGSVNFEPAVSSTTGSFGQLGHGSRHPSNLGILDHEESMDPEFDMRVSDEESHSHSHSFTNGRSSPFPTGGLFAELAQATSLADIKPVAEYKDQEVMTEPIESWIHTVPGFQVTPPESTLAQKAVVPASDISTEKDEVALAGPTVDASTVPATFIKSDKSDGDESANIGGEVSVKSGGEVSKSEVTPTVIPDASIATEKAPVEVSAESTGEVGKPEVTPATLPTASIASEKPAVDVSIEPSEEVHKSEQLPAVIPEASIASEKPSVDESTEPSEEVPKSEVTPAVMPDASIASEKPSVDESTEPSEEVPKSEVTPAVMPDASSATEKAPVDVSAESSEEVRKSEHTPAVIPEASIVSENSVSEVPDKSDRQDREKITSELSAHSGEEEPEKAASEATEPVHMPILISGKPGTETAAIVTPESDVSSPAIEARAVAATPAQGDLATSDDSSTEPAPMPRATKSDADSVTEERRHTCDMSQAALPDTQVTPPVPAIPKAIARSNAALEGRDYRVSFGSAFGNHSNPEVIENVAQGASDSVKDAQSAQETQETVSKIATASAPVTNATETVVTSSTISKPDAIVQASDVQTNPLSISTTRQSELNGQAADTYSPSEASPVAILPSTANSAHGTTPVVVPVASTAAATGVAIVKSTSRTGYTYNQNSSQAQIPGHSPHYQRITDSSGASISRSRFGHSPNGSISSMSTDYHNGGRRGSISSNYDVTATDPTMIQVITQTMIGDYLWKYTRRPIGNAISEKRHRRYFWVHPYTKTVYWSLNNPGAEGSHEQRAKSAFIVAVFQVTDENPNNRSDLPNISLLIQTTTRNLKLTAPTREKHELWYQSLSYLLSRPSTPGADIASDNQTWSEVQASRGLNGTTTVAATSSLNNDAVMSIRNNEKNVRKKGSMSRLQNMFGRNTVNNTSSSSGASFHSKDNGNSPLAGPPRVGLGTTASRSSLNITYTHSNQQQQDDSYKNVLAYPVHLSQQPATTIGGHGLVKGGSILAAANSQANVSAST